VAAGKVPFMQPIAANIDTLFVVTSCNSDFNTSRLERYPALAHAAHVTPVIVLTKSDLCVDPQAYGTPARTCVGTAASKGRNTTTVRYLFQSPCRAWLVDTPGMRELPIQRL
jgi:ribosome biogenesis GTPase / thiamine phosphate phosphatase